MKLLRILAFVLVAAPVSAQTPDIDAVLEPGGRFEVEYQGDTT